MPRALVLEPTRELADQVSESFDKYSKYSKLSHALLIGGTSMDEQTKKLERGVDVLIATPGRLMDHFNRGRILLSQVNILVIDEADRMLDMGFIPDVEEICKKLPFTRQTLFYSATMPPEIQRLTDQFLHNAVRVEVSRPATTATNITQEVVMIPANDWAKREALRRLIREAEPTLQNAIVFCNRKRDVDVVAKSLVKHGFDAAPIHGDLDQSLRTKTLDRFRANELKILVASDVAARGLDVPAVSHVFNFDVPIHADDYVHRIGRTGRAGRSGAAFMLASSRDGKYIEVDREDHRQQAGPPRNDGHRSARRAQAFAAANMAVAAGGGGGRGGSRDKDKRHQRPPPARRQISTTRSPASSRRRSQKSARSSPARPRPPSPMRPKPEHDTANSRQDKPQRQEQRPQRKADPKSRVTKSMNAAAASASTMSAPRQPEAVDKSQLPAFLFRPVPVKKLEPKE